MVGAQFLAQPIAIGRVHRMQLLELVQQRQGLAGIATVMLQPRNELELVVQVALGTCQAVLGFDQPLFQQLPVHGLPSR